MKVLITLIKSSELPQRSGKSLFGFAIPMAGLTVYPKFLTGFRSIDIDSLIDIEIILPLLRCFYSDLF